LLALLFDFIFAQQFAHGLLHQGLHDGAQALQQVANRAGPAAQRPKPSAAASKLNPNPAKSWSKLTTHLAEVAGAAWSICGNQPNTFRSTHKSFRTLAASQLRLR
jgi:hypothetical protein